VYYTSGKSKQQIVNSFHSDENPFNFSLQIGCYKAQDLSRDGIRLKIGLGAGKNKVNF
jgi:hypothetical protein